MKKMFGFTLAETLITLMIFGVIAAMTIPTLMNDARNRDNVGRLKKTSGILSTSTGLIQVEEGPVDGWEWAQEKDIIELYKPKFKVMKDCAFGKGCFPELPKALDGSSLPDYDSDAKYYKLILSDGSMVAFTSCADGSCQPSDYGLDPANTLLGGFFVDVNGLRAPNEAGKDIFFFGLVKDKGVQAGGSFSTAGCSLKNPSNGLNCAALVIKEDKISYW